MKEQAKDFNQFSESKITESSQADVLSEKESGQNTNIPSTSVDNDKTDEKPPLWIRFFEAYSRFYDRIKPVFIILWIIIILLVILPAIGELIIARSFSQPSESPEPQKHSEIIFDSPRSRKVLFASQALDQSHINRNRHQINAELLNALDKAHRITETRAKDKIDAWIDSLMFRVDYDFLNWYFGYFNRKWREDSALIRQLLGGDVKKHYGEVFEKEFSKRVISQREAERKIREIYKNVLETYLSELNYKIARIGFEYNIPQTEWNQYLDSIIFNIPGAGNTNTTLAEITAIGAYPLLAKALAIPLKGLSTVGIKSTEKIVAMAGTKYAAKLGVEGAAKTVFTGLAKAADPILIIGFAFWEVHEQNKTIEEQKPALHESIFESFKEIEYDLLHDPNSGIMATLYQIEDNIRNSISLTSSSQKNIKIPTI